MSHIEILVSKNPDHYTESYDWTLLVDGMDVASGTEYTETAAIDAATIESHAYTVPSMDDVRGFMAHLNGGAV